MTTSTSSDNGFTQYDFSALNAVQQNMPVYLKLAVGINFLRQYSNMMLQFDNEHYPDVQKCINDLKNIQGVLREEAAERKAARSK